MAQTWENNDSARMMTRKYNECVRELNQLGDIVVTVNETYLTIVPSEFAIEEEQEDADGG